MMPFFNTQLYERTGEELVSKDWHFHGASPLHASLVNLRNRTGEERRRQTLCDKRDNNFV